jgi:hypothetical protein
MEDPDKFNFFPMISTPVLEMANNHPMLSMSNETIKTKKSKAQSILSQEEETKLCDVTKKL